MLPQSISPDKPRQRRRQILQCSNGGLALWLPRRLAGQCAVAASQRQTGVHRRRQRARRVDNLPQLKRQYEKRVDAAFRDIQANGFRIARDILGRPVNLPHVHIGRGGEILYGTKGNHRLAMAKLLALRVIPCHVRARHADWQKIRETILRETLLSEATLSDGAMPSDIYREFMGHPDLADLYFPNQ